MKNNEDQTYSQSLPCIKKALNKNFTRPQSEPDMRKEQPTNRLDESFMAVIKPIDITKQNFSDDNSSQPTITMLTLKKSRSRSSISMLDKILSPSILSSRRNIKSFECIQVIGSRAFVHSAAATILADKLGYFGCHITAASALPIATFTGVINGLYDCGEKMENELSPSGVWWLLKKISSGVYQSVNCITQCIPECIRPYVRPVLIGASACGTAATIVADFIVHLFNAGVFTNPSVTGVACPTIIVFGVISGSIASIIIVYRTTNSDSEYTHSLNST